MFSFKLSFHIFNFHPLEVSGRGCETQLQVGQNLGPKSGTLPPNLNNKWMTAVISR